MLPHGTVVSEYLVAAGVLTDEGSVALVALAVFGSLRAGVRDPHHHVELALESFYLHLALVPSFRLLVLALLLVRLVLVQVLMLVEIQVLVQRLTPDIAVLRCG